MKHKIIPYIILAFILLIAVFAPDYDNPNIANAFLDGGASIWVPLLITALSTAGNLAGQSASNQQAGIERQRYQDQLQGRIDDLNSWFESENAKDFLATDVAQSSIRGLMKREDQQLSSLTNAATMGGATAESVIAGKGKLNENFADAIGRLLGYGTQYKQGLRQQYDYRLQSLYQPMDQLSQQKIQDYSNLSNNIQGASNSITTAAGMVDWEELLGNQDKPSGGTGGNTTIP